jgi:hypothetical protein
MYMPVIYKGIPTRYLVDETGVVFDTKLNKIAPQYTSSNGYMVVYMNIPTVGRKVHRVHRLVATAFIPNPKNKPQVNHIDGVKTHNWVSNLEWCTASENAIHAFKNGLVHQAKGEKSGAHIYTDEMVRKVCEYLVEGKLSCSEIAKKMGMDRSLVNAIRLRRNWTHISKDYEFNDKPRPSWKEVNYIIDNLIYLGHEREDIIHVICDKFKLKRKLVNRLYQSRLGEHKRRGKHIFHIMVQ